MIHVLRDYKKNAGRRGAFLAVFGFLGVLYGVRTLLAPPGVIYTHSYLDDIMSRDNWALCFAATGIAAMAFALVPRHNQGKDVPGFLFAMSMPMVWFSGLLAQGVVEWELQPVLSSLVYFIWTIALYITAGWPEPPDPTGGIDHERN